MNLDNRKIWQVAAGDNNRDFVKICLDYGVILLGPGHLGSFSDKYNVPEITPRRWQMLNTFHSKIKDGDIVVLRLGTTEVHAIGVIKGGYEHSEFFGDIDGWSMQHVRRVAWIKSYHPEPMRFDNYALKLGDSVQEMTNPEIRAIIQTLDEPKTDRPPPLPNGDRSTDLDEIGRYLYSKGVASQAIDRFTGIYGELKRIAAWYEGDMGTDDDDIAPSEYETVSYLVLPLLNALGWSHQKTAIEWHKIDVALFNAMPRIDENLTAVVEVKRKGNSCLTAFDQAARYASTRVNCGRFILTDGIRYGVFLKTGNEFKLSAYLNLLRPMENYAIYKCLGAKDALQMLAPEWQQSQTN